MSLVCFGKNRNCLLDVTAAQKLYNLAKQGKFLALLKQSIDRGKLQITGEEVKTAGKKARGGLCQKAVWLAPDPASTTSAATPTAWRSPTTVFSKSKTEKLP